MPVDDGEEAGDPERWRSLAAAADILIEDRGPDEMTRLGLGRAECESANPGLVYCSLTAAGVIAPAAPGHDLLMQAIGGLMSITGEVDGPPQRAGAPLVDGLAGLFLGVGALAAVRHRRGSGAGQAVGVDLLSASLAGLVNQAGGYTIAGRVPGRLGNDHPSVTPYGLLATGDGELVVAVGNDRQFVALCEVLGLPELGADERFATNSARTDNRPLLRELLERQLAVKGAEEWAAELLERRVPAGVVNDLPDAQRLAGRLGLRPEQPIRLSAPGPARVAAEVRR